mmetsp:Transcript_22391/g.32097  ORF Transcript_22391/g.32097 Transcript_22391/m.32097 type:complete len:347 (-) Transcript_22391:298-1338(-)
MAHSSCRLSLWRPSWRSQAALSRLYERLSRALLGQTGSLQYHRNGSPRNVLATTTVVLQLHRTGIHQNEGATASYGISTRTLASQPASDPTRGMAPWLYVHQSLGRANVHGERTWRVSKMLTTLTAREQPSNKPFGTRSDQPLKPGRVERNSGRRLCMAFACILRVPFCHIMSIVLRWSVRASSMSLKVMIWKKIGLWKSLIGKATQRPGEMVLYESGSLIHGRPFPLKGGYYANVFIHFEPVSGPDHHKEDNDTEDKKSKIRTKGSVLPWFEQEAARDDDIVLPPYIIPHSPEVANWKQQNPKGWLPQQNPHRIQNKAHHAASIGDMQTLVRIVSLFPMKTGGSP